jgi:hypothetical protein
MKTIPFEITRILHFISKFDYFTISPRLRLLNKYDILLFHEVCFILGRNLYWLNLKDLKRTLVLVNRSIWILFTMSERILGLFLHPLKNYTNYDSINKCACLKYKRINSLTGVNFLKLCAIKKTFNFRRSLGNEGFVENVVTNKKNEPSVHLHQTLLTSFV